jgi:hypothetical protein
MNARPGAFIPRVNLIDGREARFRGEVNPYRPGRSLALRCLIRSIERSGVMSHLELVAVRMATSNRTLRDAHSPAASACSCASTISTAPTSGWSRMACSSCRRLAMSRTDALRSFWTSRATAGICWGPIRGHRRSRSDPHRNCCAQPFHSRRYPSFSAFTSGVENGG